MTLEEEQNKLTGKLTRYGERFDVNVEASLPVLTKAGKPRVHQHNKRTKAYWQAQCSFRSLKSAGSTEELQIRIRTRDKGCDGKARAELSDIEARLSRLEKICEQRAWPGLPFAVKFDKDPGRALKDTFAAQTSVGPLVVVVDYYEQQNIRTMCLKLGIEHQLVEAPIPGFFGNSVRCSLVAGTDKANVWAKAKDILAVAHRRDAEHKAQQEAFEREQEAAARKREADELAQFAAVQAAAFEREGEWDLTGVWQITCPEITEGWGEAELTMAISCDTAEHNYPSSGDDDSEGEYGYDEDEEEAGAADSQRQAAGQSAAGQRYYANFNFNVHEGIMRISGEVGHDNQANCRMSYRWRGRETGEGQIECNSDEVVYKMVFSNRGTKLAGTFGGGCVGDCEFTGVKVRLGNKQQSSSQEEWRQLSERAWNRECGSRWH